MDNANYLTFGNSLDGASNILSLSISAPNVCILGRTLVGSGLKPKSYFSRPLASLIPKNISFIPENVKSFSPQSSTVTTVNGRDISYETLVVAAGIQSNFDSIKGLPDALADPASGVSSIYSYKTCDKVWSEIESLNRGNAVFTQPSGIIKCAGGMYRFVCYKNMSDPCSSSKNYVDGLGPIPKDWQE